MSDATAVLVQETEENVQITSQGIKNSLKKYTALQAVSELIWNGFDAGASQVEVTIPLNILESVDSISIRDNGCGIDKDKLATKFKPFFQSEKIYDPQIKHSTTHGKNGVGRLTFFTFANFATWHTVYRKENTCYAYTIEVSATELQRYRSTVPAEAIHELPGTTVILNNIFSNEISPSLVREYLSLEFCWFLELNKNKNYSIIINGDTLTYDDLIIAEEQFNYTHGDSKTTFEVRYVCWNKKLSEYSKYYYINSQGREIAKENTTLNNKGDRFYHSVYIQSALFNRFDLQSKLAQLSYDEIRNRNFPEYKYVMGEVNRHLFDLRRPLLKKHVSEVIDLLEIEAAFPNFDKNNPIDQYKKSQVEVLISSIYIAQPKIFTQSMNKEQRKTFIRLLDLTMQSGEVEALFSIFEEILDMDEQERQDLSDILKYTKLSNVTKTINLIKDRYQAVADLKQMVFNPDLRANEVNHLQKFIEGHYWLLGEEYSLVTAAEPTFEAALRRYLHYLHEEYKDATVDHPDKYKQMDIFAVRQDIAHGAYNNIVVELKHPSLPLGEKQLSQVKKYMRTILSIPQFNASNMTWEFYLVGTKFDSTGFIEGEIKTNKVHGEQSLAFKADNYKVYVLTWSELFANFEMRYSHLNQKLQLEQGMLQRQYITADEVLDAQAASSAMMAPEMSLPI